MDIEICAKHCNEFGPECLGFQFSMEGKKECILQGFNDITACTDYQFCRKIEGKVVRNILLNHIFFHYFFQQ